MHRVLFHGAFTGHRLKSICIEMLEIIRGRGVGVVIVLVLICCGVGTCTAQDYDDGQAADVPPPRPKEVEECNGIFASYSSQGRVKEYPLVKNVTGQAWAFQATATVLNAGSEELKSWQLFIGFQYEELLVSVDGAVVVDGDGSFPFRVGKNGTTLAGYPQADLKTAIDTASDFTQMQVEVKLKGTQFGGAGKETPMPKTIKIVNPGYKCPPPAKKAGGAMHVCCKKDPKFKDKNLKTKFMPRRYGDLDFAYDILQASDNRYLAQVTIDNNHPLGRLDQWNLTWEWMRNEFINSMKGAYTHKRDPSECIYGPQGSYYKDFDFSNVMSCSKKPIIADLPPERENDEKTGKLPHCCKDGILLPKSINETKARAIFQVEVLKLPPDLTRTAITPPQNWKIVGRLNPNYKCGPPVRVDSTEFPDPTGLDATVSAIATWQVTCNMTHPNPRQSKCCVSYSAYYSDTAIPCNTCACGCDGDSNAHCDANAPAMVLPPNALLVPFVNRTAKAKAFAAIKHHKIPKKMPCADNCGVSINWHIDSDYKTGWTARMTIFNWEKDPFVDWFSAIQLKEGYQGFVKTYSFNATKVPKLKNTVLMRGLPGLEYLVGETNASHPTRDPPVPGKQQSAITFSKRDHHLLKVEHGDGFPSRLYFNGEECALPKQFPKRNGGAARHSPVRLLPAAFLTFLLLSIGFN